MMDNKSPKISVLMSVYNGEKYLKKSVSSILGQSFKDFEFIIIDDGSIDSSFKILNSIKDSRIFLVKNDKNIGLTKSLNKGLELARGKYIARLDADDVACENRLRLQYDIMEKGNYSMLGGWAIVVDDNFSILKLLRPLTRCIDLRFKLLFSNTFIHSTAFFDREKALNIGGYDSQYYYSQDYDLWSKLSRCGRVGNIPEFLVFLRDTSSSISRANSQEQYEYARKISKRNKQVISRQNLNSSEIPFLDDLYLEQSEIYQEQLINPSSLSFIKIFCNFFQYSDKDGDRILYQIYYRYLQWADKYLFTKNIHIISLVNCKLLKHPDNLRLFIVILIKRILGKQMSEKLIAFFRLIKTRKTMLEKSIK